MTTDRLPPALVTPSRSGPAPGPARWPQAGPRRPGPAARARWFLLAWLVAFLVLAATAPGQMIFDTKLGVDLAPGSFFAGLWHLWDPVQWLGALGDQSIGYAFPMAPFYLAGATAHLPVWITERLWLSLLTAAGFWGMVKLAAALRIGSGGARVLAGVVFALWPTFTIVIGSTSAAALPGLLVPWVILPLVGENRSPRVAAARSGVAVLCMGGVNAVSTIDALVLPALFILLRPRARRRPLALWWIAAVAAATAWWAIPLLLQGRYSFNFLPYVEQAGTTTRTMSAAAFVRGSGNWTAYFNLGTPWDPAGWAVVTAPAAIAASAAAAALGLYGLARRDLPEGRWLRVSVAVVALVALAGYPGPLGGPVHTLAEHLLDGPLAPFRGVYKLEQVLAVALPLGLAHTLGRCWRRAIVFPTRGGRMAASVVTAPVVVAILAGLALPYLSGQILGTGSFSRIPAYWYQVANFLAAHSAREPALVTPADAHGTYLWGDPIDDPLEALARSPWVERGLVPYGGAGSQDFLTTAETAMESGERVPGLAAFLARAGIRYVVVRNDLDPTTLGYTAPETVHETLGLSGFRRVAAFGPQLSGAATDPQAPPQIQGLLPSYPAVEVYEAVSPGDQPASPVTASPLSQTVLVNGGPDALLQLESQGILGSRPAVIAGDRTAAAPAVQAVTDGLRRADNAFGLITSNASFTYTATETNPVDQALGGGGGPPRQILPVPAAGHQTVAVLSGAATVTASSYGSWLAELPQYDPVNAFDGNPATAWAEGNPATPVGQWIQITFDHAVTMPRTVGIQLLDDTPIRAIADRVEVSTAAGRVSTSLKASGATQPLRVPPGPTRWLRLTITGARGAVPGGPGAGLSDILIPGVQVTRYLQPPQAAAGQAAPAVAYSFQQQVPSPSSLADPNAYPPLARTFVTASADRLRVQATALALPGPSLDNVLERLAPAGNSVLRISASSTFGSLPQFSPDNLVSGTGNVPWIAASADPVLSLSWHGPRTISGLAVEPASGISATPESVQITSPDGTRTAPIGVDGLVQFAPLTTDRINISFPTVAADSIPNPISGQLTPLPISLDRLSIPALAGLHVSAPNPAVPFRLPCGQGPSLTLDGRRYPTSVSGTLGDLTQFLPVQVQVCTPAASVSLAAGRHALTAATPGAFSITDVSLTQSAAATAPATPATPATPADDGTARTVRVTSWQADARQVTVGPGTAAYLEVHENYNPGWTATLAGRSLTPVRLDGWEQAFVVPAGQGGTVTLSYTPTGLYHVVLLVSAAAVLALLIAACWKRRAWPGPSNRSGSGVPAPSTAVGGPAPSTAVGVSAPSTAAGVPSPSTGAGASAPSTAARVRWADRSRRLLPLTAVMFVVGGPVALAVPALAAVKHRWPRWIPPLALAAMAAAGVLAAVAAQPAGLGSGTFGAPAQACALIALAAALTPVLPGARGQAIPEPPGPPGPPGQPDQPDQDGQEAGPGHPMDGDSHDGRGTPACVPFGVVDELTCYYDDPAEPANVHLEARVAGHLNQRLLREAVLAALAAEPRATVRRAPGGAWRRRYAWEFPPHTDHDPVQRVAWVDERDLARKRTAFLAAAPPLDSSPPVRLLLAAGHSEDCLILNAHHAALDGLSCLQLLRTIAAYYGSAAGQEVTTRPEEAAVPAGPPAPASALAGPAPATRVGSRRPRLPRPTRLTRMLPLPTARIAAHHQDRRTGRREPGYGFHLATWPNVPVVPASRDGLPRRDGLRFTVNDVLVAAMIVAVGRWNRAHGRSSGRIRITVPLGHPPRPADGAGETALGNLSSLASVTARLPRRTGSYRKLLADVARQTQHAKTQHAKTRDARAGDARAGDARAGDARAGDAETPAGAQVDLISRGLVAAWLPARVKRRLVRAALRALGPMYCDTSLVSNLGDLGDPPRFGPAPSTRMWFSTAAHLPRGLSLGVVTVGGKVHLCLRYRRALFDQRAAADFAHEYLAALAALTSDGPGW